MSLTKNIERKVKMRLGDIQCERELISWIVDIERDRHFLRKRLGNTMIQNGRNLNAISRSAMKY